MMSNIISVGTHYYKCTSAQDIHNSSHVDIDSRQEHLIKLYREHTVTNAVTGREHFNILF